MSNKTISILLGVAGLIIALIGGGLMWVYPEKKWIGWILIGLGVAVFFGFVIYLIIAVNRKEVAQNLLTAQPQQLPQGGIVNAPHNEFKPSNEFKPTLIVNMPAPQSQEQQQAKDDQTKLSAKPAFKVTVPVTSRPGLVRLDVNVLRMAKPDEDGTLFPILVEFENLPSGKGKSAEVKDVWAHITYRDFDFMNAELARVGSGCWIDQPIPDVSFPIRMPRYLMLGGWHINKAEPMVNEFRIFEYSRDLHRAVEKEVKIAAPKEPFVVVNGQLVIAKRRLVVDVVLTSNGHHDDACEYQFHLEIFGGDGTGHGITCVKKPELGSVSVWPEKEQKNHATKTSETVFETVIPPKSAQALRIDPMVAAGEPKTLNEMFRTDFPANTIIHQNYEIQFRHEITGQQINVPCEAQLIANLDAKSEFLALYMAVPLKSFLTTK